MTSAKVVSLSTSNFEQEVTQSPTPVLVDFWAEWCGPCKMIGPVIDEIAEEKAGKLKVGKVNVDENQELATKFGIRAIPTLLIFKDGQEGANRRHDRQKGPRKKIGCASGLTGVSPARRSGWRAAV